MVRVCGAVVALSTLVSIASADGKNDGKAAVNGHQTEDFGFPFPTTWPIHGFPTSWPAGDIPPWLSSIFQPWSIVPVTPTNSPTTSLTSIPTTAVPTTSSPASPTGKAPACKKVQYNFTKGQGQNAQRAQAVAQAYRYAWDGYKKYAFGYDELLPLSAAGTNDWYGWGVTIVDGIDTAIVMNLTDIVAEQLAFIEKIDFTTTLDGPVEMFDTNIRYVGGLLSAYDLLKSGQFPSPYPDSQVDALLKQAVILANKLAYGFNTPTGLSAGYVNFDNNTPVLATYQIGSTTYNAINTASTGSFILEWFRLSDLTGNETYRELTARAESYLVNPNPKPVYPGLVGTEFDTDNGKMLTFDGGWHSGVDSFVEYLIKTYQYQQTNITTGYKNFWLKAVDSTIQHLSVAPQGFPHLKFLSELDVNGSLTYSEDSFTCFAGGNQILGGAFLGSPQIVELGLATTDSCHQTYNQSLTGLGPTYWAWYNQNGQAYSEQDNNDSIEKKNAAKSGFFYVNGNEGWEFRPEELESIFYSHRVTGDPRWAEYTWQIFEAFQSTSKNNIAYATVNNVNMPFGGSMSDNMDSFLFAEVLKYMYLTFSDPSVVSLDQWVFNTECHPFLVQCGIGAAHNYHS